MRCVDDFGLYKYILYYPFGNFVNLMKLLKFSKLIDSYSKMNIYVYKN